MEGRSPAPRAQPPGSLPAAAESRHREEFGLEFSRIVAFSDGVFAIAITLLVLAIEVPENAADLSSALANQEGDFFAYALSFAVVGKLWLAHHRFFTAVERFDSRLMGVNLLYLGFVALVPFSSELLGDYSATTDAIVVYALNMAAVGLIGAGMHVYCYRNGLMKQEATPVQELYAGRGSLVVPAVFLLSIPVAVVAPAWAPLVWLGLFVSPLLRRL